MVLRVSIEEAIARGWVKPGMTEKSTSQNTQKRSQRKNEKEGEEQALVVEQFNRLCPDYAHLLIHIPNGGSRKNTFEGWRLKKQGVKPGVSDLFLPVAKGGYFGLWIEFKAEPPFDANVSESQLQWIASMQNQGYQADVCRGVKEALDRLLKYTELPSTNVR